MRSILLHTLIISILTFSSQSNLFSQCSCTTQYTIPAGNSSVNVFAGETYCFTTGTFTGNLNIYAGGKICISKFATFKPGNINNFAGTIENYGTLTINQSFSFSTGALIDNYGVFNLNSNLNFNGSATILNEWEGKFFINVDFNLNNNSTFTNLGTVISKGAGHNFSTNNNSTVNNHGILRIQDGNFNPQGTLLNEGMIFAGKQININSGSTVTNNCRFVSDKGLNNNSSNFTNNGLVWMAGTNGNEAHLQNNGGSKIINGANAQVRGVRFTNGGTVNGNGEFYFTEQTKQQGTFIGTVPADPIRFFDLTQTGTKIMDIESPAPTNTFRPATMDPMDTLSFGNICADQNYRDLLTIGQLPLPIKLKYFKGTCDNGDIKLTWVTSEEVNITGYNVEASVDGVNFIVTGNIIARGKEFNYSFTADNSPFKYFRLAVQEKGYQSYSDIISVNCQDKNNSNSDLSITPNPNNGQFKIGFEAAGNEIIEVKILNVRSQIIYSDNVNVDKGSNSIEIQLGSAPAGIYIVVIKDSKGITSHQRFVIN